MTKARNLADNALTTVSPTELGYLDGVTSNVQTQIDAQIPDSLLTTTGDTIYASGASTPARLGIGSTGQVLTVAGGVPTWATPASGVTTWTARQNPTGTSIYTIAYNGSNLYIAAGQNGVLYSSPDAITWTSRTSGFGANGIQQVIYGGGLWVAVGDAGLISTSTDGITWTARTANVATNQLYAVAYGSGRYVAVGAGANGGTGGITSSTDGITWTKATTPSTTGAAFQCVTSNGAGTWLVGGSFSTNNMVFSTNGTTWTTQASGRTTTVCQVFYTNSTWYAFHNAQQAQLTTQATPSSGWVGAGDAVSIGSPYSKSTMNIYNSRFYFLPYQNSTSGSIGGGIASCSIATSNNQFNNFNPLILIPFMADTGTGTGAYTALYMNSSNGQIILADGVGRIYTSF